MLIHSSETPQSDDAMCFSSSSLITSVAPKGNQCPVKRPSSMEAEPFSHQGKEAKRKRLMKFSGEGENKERKERGEEETLTGGLSALQRLAALLPSHGVDIDEVLGQRRQAFQDYGGHRPIDHQLKG